MDTEKSEKRNLYRRQRVDLAQKDLLSTTSRTSTSSKKQFVPALVFAIVFWTLVFIACQVTINTLAPTSAAETSAFEMYVTSGIFKDDGTQSPYVVNLEIQIQKILQIILPTMSLLSITLVLLSLVASVLYLFKQDFFDQVYEAKTAVKNAKINAGSIYKSLTGGGGNGSGGVGGAMSAVTGRLSSLGTTFIANDAVTNYGFLKCYVIPNLKAWAFYEATESHMTVLDFLKKNAIKSIMMFSFCILISDQTMLDLFLKGASVGTYVFKRAAEIDYVKHLDNFLTSGTDYKPYWNAADGTKEKNKIQTFNVGYQVLKGMCDINNEYQRSTDFKTHMGQQLQNYIDEQMSNVVPFDNDVFVVKCEEIDYAIYQRVMSTGGNTSSSYCMSTADIFDQDSPLAGKYLRFYISSKRSEASAEKLVNGGTSPQNAWGVDKEGKLILSAYKAYSDYRTGNSVFTVVNSASSITVNVFGHYTDSNGVNHDVILHQKYQLNGDGSITRTSNPTIESGGDAIGSGSVAEGSDLLEAPVTHTAKADKASSTASDTTLGITYAEFKAKGAVNITGGTVSTITIDGIRAIRFDGVGMNKISASKNLPQTEDGFKAEVTVTVSEISAVPTSSATLQYYRNDRPGYNTEPPTK